MADRCVYPAGCAFCTAKRECRFEGRCGYRKQGIAALLQALYMLREEHTYSGGKSHAV